MGMPKENYFHFSLVIGKDNKPMNCMKGKERNKKKKKIKKLF